MAVIINIANILNGNFPSREIGEQIRTLIKEGWDNGDFVQLDFNSCTIAYSGFFDEIAVLVAPCEGAAQKISAVNMKDVDQKLFNKTIAQRKGRRKS